MKAAGKRHRLTEKSRWGDPPFDMREVHSASAADLEMTNFEFEYSSKTASLGAWAGDRRSRQEELRTSRFLFREGIPTAAAVLTLGKEPQRWFPGAFIRFVRFGGREVTNEILNQLELKGVLQEQLQSLDQLLEVNIKTGLAVPGARHEKPPSYPLVALRELIYNAVIHRAYGGLSGPTQICWFSDRVQITSPGGLFGIVTPETFGLSDSTDYRNPTIARMMRDFGFTEKFGLGLATVKKELERNGNPPPEFEFREESVSVTVTANERRPSSTVARPSGGG